jgi:hypothetical protein
MDDSRPPPSRTERLINLATDAAARAKPDSDPGELQQLYAQLVQAIIASREVQKAAGGKPTDDQHVEAIIDRINEILE